jgi:hypothetical protein
MLLGRFFSALFVFTHHSGTASGKSSVRDVDSSCRNSLSSLAIIMTFSALKATSMFNVNLIHKLGELFEAGSRGS